MKRFILHTGLFMIVVGLSFLGLLSRADGSYDEFYLRFTSPKQQNLILGTSRSAQGILPSVLNHSLERSFLNYSFTLNSSPYGLAYLKSIQKKIDSETTDGIFILSVDPWSISNRGLLDDVTSVRENNSFLATTDRVTMNPNFEYLLENLNSAYRILLPKRKTMILHRDGWLEITIPMDDASVAQRTATKFKTYRELVHEFSVSSERISALTELVTFLRTKGRVYLVRLPVHPEMARIENELMPTFEEGIQPAIRVANDYLDLSSYNDKLEYTDGNHLYKESGRRISEIIGDWIKRIED